MATDTILFVYGSYTLEIATPSYPGTPNQDLDQWRATAMGGRVVSVLRSDSEVSDPLLYWPDLSDSERDDLKTFFFDQVGGTGNDITYTDQDGIVSTVQYIGGIETSRMVNFDCWEVSL